MKRRLSEKSTGIVVLALAVVAVGIVMAAQTFQKKVEVTTAVEAVAKGVHFEPLNKRGLTQSQIDVFDAALRNYQADHTAKAPLMNLGYIYLESKQFDQSQKAFTTYLGWDSLDSEARLGYARALCADGKTVDCEVQYIELLHTDPVFMQGYRELVALYQSGTVGVSEQILDIIEQGRKLDTKKEYLDQLNAFAKQFTSLKINATSR